MFEKMVEPILNRMTTDEDQMNHLFITTEKVDNRLDELRETIFNQRGRLDVFEQINLKIAKGEDERKLLAHNIKSIEQNVNAHLDAIDGTHNVQKKVFGNLEKYSKEVMSELSDLKSVYKDQCDAFIGRLSKLNNHLNDEVETLTRHCNAIDRTLANHEK